jgi:hypothetical protein
VSPACVSVTLHVPFFLKVIVEPVLEQAGPLVLRLTSSPDDAVAATFNDVPTLAVAGRGGDTEID